MQLRFSLKSRICCLTELLVSVTFSKKTVNYVVRAVKFEVHLLVFSVVQAIQSQSSISYFLQDVIRDIKAKIAITNKESLAFREKNQIRSYS
jgi:hypothetical protein